MYIFLRFVGVFQLSCALVCAGTQQESVKVPLSKLPHAVDIGVAKEASPKTEETREVVVTASKKEEEKRLAEVPEPVSHEAEYEVKFVADQDPTYKGAAGTMLMQVKRFENDWVMEQTTTLISEDEDGGKETTISKFTTYENHEGNAYEFNARAVRSNRDDASQTDLVDFTEGEIEEDISGRGRLVAKDGPGTVVYEKPEELSIDLPAGTVFPMTHLKMLIAKALTIKGKNLEVLKKVKVFDGSSDVQQAVRIDAVIGAVDAKKKVIISSDTSIYKPEKLWRVEMSVYISDEMNEPDYKITQVISNLGVIHEIIIDYDGYKMHADLQKLKIYEEDEAARNIKIGALSSGLKVDSYSAPA